MGTVEENNAQSVTVRLRPPGRAPKNRASYSLTIENYDYLCKESFRHGVSLSDALNFMIDELQQWRSGARRFVERRKQQR